MAYCNGVRMFLDFIIQENFLLKPMRELKLFDAATTVWGLFAEACKLGLASRVNVQISGKGHSLLGVPQQGSVT